MKRWDDEAIEHCLKKMRHMEQIPSSRQKEAIRDKLIGAKSRAGVVETKLGWIGLVFSESGLRALQLPRTSRGEAYTRLQAAFPESEILNVVPETYAVALADYARGRTNRFELSLDLRRVPPFQHLVLDAIQKIPFGETRTYGWVARAIGEPGASRAVGQALNKNPIPIIIPCHRVIASDGTLGGYAGGLAMKERLIALEKESLQITR